MQVSTFFILPAPRRKSMLILFMTLCLMLLILSMASGLTASLKSLQPTAQTTDKAAPRIRVLHFTLTPLGLNPTAMTVPEGKYLIEVTNRSDFSEFSLNLGQLSSYKLKEVNAIKKHGEWSGLFDLKHDDFVLTINEKPEWTANIQVIKD